MTTRKRRLSEYDGECIAMKRHDQNSCRKESVLFFFDWCLSLYFVVLHKL